MRWDRNYSPQGTPLAEKRKGKTVANRRKKIARLRATMTKAWRIWCKAHTAKERAERAEGKTYNTYCKALNALNAARDEAK